MSSLAAHDFHGSDPHPNQRGLRSWWSSYLGRRLVGELLLVTALFSAYRYIRLLTRNDSTEAMGNAQRVVHLERRLHLFNEQGLQNIVLNSHGLVAFFNRYYVTAHFTLTAVFVVWLYGRHPDVYPRVRNWFAMVTAAALLIHVTYPLAPPRMIRTIGFVDTLQRYGPRIYSTNTSDSLANQFAAMPSLHFGWAVMVAVSVVAIKRTRRSLVVLLHPAVTLLAIVVTANHYWLDAAVALFLVVSAAALLRVVGHIRVEDAAQRRPTRETVPTPTTG